MVSIGEELIDDEDHQDPISTREEDDRTNDRKIPAVTELIATSECNALDDDGKLRDDAGNTVTVEIGDDTVTTNEVLEGGRGGTGGSSERNESGHEYNLRKLTNHSKPWRGGVTRQLDPKNFFVQAEILDYRAETTEAMFTQVSLKIGIKMYGDAGIQAVREEMHQLHRMGCLEPQLTTREQKRQALSYLMYLKRKNCGRIKGRGCADGRKQRNTINKHEATSPTVSTEAVLVTCMVDALKGREVAIIDIPGAYLHAEMNDVVFVMFHGKMVELLENIDPKIHKPYVEIDGTGKRFFTRS